jgi:glycosyltransferase involved in cell wall biosynthesis
VKIGHIVPSLEIRHGGPSRSVRQLAKATASLGHEVDLLTSAPSVAGEVENHGRLTVRTWRREWPGAICRVPALAAHLERTSYDIVHHHALWLRTLHYARRKAARDGIPLVISPRGMMSRWAWNHHRARKAFAAQWVHPGAFAAATGWHATSPEEADEIRALGFTQPICVAPNGVDAPTTVDVAAARIYWRSRVPAVDTRRVALFYSRFHEKKRVIELIDLWAQSGPPDWLLLVAGLPEQYSVEQLRAQAMAAGAADRIQIHDGTGHPPPYSVASLFLLPSHSENFGLVIAEAMAHGIPVITTDMTPWSSLNTNTLGWCVPWTQFEPTLARAMAEPADSLAARGAQAREWVLREFSWEKSARALAAFYATLKK